MTFREIPARFLSVAYDAVMAMLLAFLFLFAIGREIGVGRMHLSQCLVVILGAAILAFWLDRSRAEQVWGLLFVVAATAILHFLAGISNMTAFWSAYGEWLFQGTTPEQHVFRFYDLQCLWTVLVISILWQLLKKIPVMDYVLAGVGLVLPLQSFFGLYVLNKQAIAFSFVLCLYCSAGLVQQSWEKQRNSGDLVLRNRCYRVFLLPAFLLLLLLLLALPAKDTPLEWTTVRSLIARIEEKWITYRVNGEGNLQNDFYMDMSGLSEDMSVEGSSNSTSQAYMTLQCSNTPETNLYLTGYVWKDFDGRNWNNSSSIAAVGGLTEQAYKDAHLDTMETLYAIDCVEGNLEEYLKYSQASITVKYFHSDSLFLPIKMLTTKEPENLAGKEEQILGYGSSYEFNYFQINLNSVKMYELLENGHEENEQAWDALNYMRRSDGPIYSYEELLAYRERMKNDYSGEVKLGKATEAWLEEVYEKAAETTGKKSAEALTSLERLAALEQALADLAYTRTPGEMPDRVDTPEEFLDYFLVESKSGYCTYFASAFVLLARNEGYPARLCQGFSTASKGNKELNVAGTNAHAWPEVYFEGIGWIPFEPTPGYYEARYSAWGVKDDSWKNYYAALAEQRRQEEAARLEAMKAEKAENPEQEENVLEKLLAPLIKLGIAIISLTLLGGILYGLYLVLQAKRILKMNTGERFDWLGRQTLKTLDKLTVTREMSETLEEYSGRMARAGYSWTATLQNLERVLYSGEEATEEMCTQALQEIQEITAQCGGRKNRIITYLQKNIGK